MGKLETFKCRSFSGEGICLSFRWALITLLLWNHLAYYGLSDLIHGIMFSPIFLPPEGAMQIRAFALRYLALWLCSLLFLFLARVVVHVCDFVLFFPLNISLSMSRERGKNILIWNLVISYQKGLSIAGLPNCLTFMTFLFIASAHFFIFTTRLLLTWRPKFTSWEKNWLVWTHRGSSNW